MTKILENIWILTTISSLITFAEKGLFEDAISSFAISDKNLYLKKKNNILFVIDASEKKKVKVSVSIFGRPTPVELDFLQVHLEK